MKCFFRKASIALHPPNYWPNILLGLVLYGFCNLLPADPKRLASKEIQLENQGAANFTHLDWHHFRGQSVTVLLTPIINRSGIPLENKEESTDNFGHGTIPLSINQLFASLVSSSLYFTAAGDNSDYQFRLRINQYQLPYDYSANSHWWQKLLGGVQRMVSNGKGAKISVSLEITPNRKSVPFWQKEIKVIIADCELNSSPQVLIGGLNQDKRLSNYLQSPAGQAFVAASNYLILEAIEFINSHGSTAHVEEVNGNQIRLSSKNHAFTLGEILPLYHGYSPASHQNPALLRRRAGVVQIISAFENQAIAYPVDLSAKSVMQGDWVRMGKARRFSIPRSVFVPMNKCADKALVPKSLSENTAATR